MRIHGITPEFVRKARDRGFNDLSVDHSSRQESEDLSKQTKTGNKFFIGGIWRAW